MVEAKQYGERVNIVKYVRVEKKWRFASVVEKQGRVIRDQVWICRTALLLCGCCRSTR